MSRKKVSVLYGTGDLTKPEKIEDISGFEKKNFTEYKSTFPGTTYPNKQSSRGSDFYYIRHRNLKWDTFEKNNSTAQTGWPFRTLSEDPIRSLLKAPPQEILGRRGGCINPLPGVKNISLIMFSGSRWGLEDYLLLEGRGFFAS